MEKRCAKFRSPFECSTSPESIRLIHADMGVSHAGTVDWFTSQILTSNYSPICRPLTRVRISSSF